MTTYPTQPTGDNSVDLTNIFASSATNKIIMSTEEILEGYNNDGEAVTPLTSTPDGNKFNYFWYQVHNTLAWVVNYAKALFDNKLELSGGTMTGALALGINKATSSYVPLANADLTNKLYVDTAVSGAMWLSEVKYLAYTTIPTLPSGVEVVNCDGRALSKTTYSALYALIGITYGGTEVGTTFNIPDLRGKYIVGWNGSGSLDTTRSFGSDQKRENSKYTWKYDYLNPENKIWSQTYTATEDGIIEASVGMFSGSGGSFAYLIINNIQHLISSAYTSGDAVSFGDTIMVPIFKGDTYVANGGYRDQYIKFYPKIQSNNNSTSTQTNMALYPVIRIK